VDERSLAHPAARYPTPEQRLDARAHTLWAEQSGRFVYRGKSAWLVPSQSKDGVLYPVQLRGEERGCGCIAYAYRKDCAHYRAARLAQIRTGSCSGCGERKPYRELIEVTEDHDSLTWFVGDLLCIPECAGNHGVL
jgi:hypothetical protein